MKDEYNIRIIGFNDDTLTLDNKRIIDICKEIIERGLDIRWFAGTRTDCVSFEMLKWMRKSGCFSIGDSPETGSQKILNIINKKFTVSRVIKSHAMYKKAGMSTTIGIMVGNPGETSRTIKATIKLLDKTRPDGCGINLTTVYPATGLYELAKRQGFIDDDYWLNSKNIAPVYTVEHSVEQLLEWKKEIMLHFWFRIFGFKRITKFALENPSTLATVFPYWLKRTFSKRSQIM